MLKNAWQSLKCRKILLVQECLLASCHEGQENQFLIIDSRPFLTSAHHSNHAVSVDSHLLSSFINRKKCFWYSGSHFWAQFLACTQVHKYTYAVRYAVHAIRMMAANIECSYEKLGHHEKQVRIYVSTVGIPQSIFTFFVPANFPRYPLWPNSGKKIL